MSTMPPTDEEEVSISGVSPVTVTVSDTVATFSVMLMSSVWPTDTTMSLFSTFEKPGSSAVRS